MNYMLKEFSFFLFPTVISTVIGLFSMCEIRCSFFTCCMSCDTVPVSDISTENSSIECHLISDMIFIFTEA